MKRLIDEYGLAILYAIVGAFCLVLFGMIFLGDNTKISNVVTNVVDNSTNNNLNVVYKINYDLTGGKIILAENQPYGTLIASGENNCAAGKCNIYDLSKIKIRTGDVDEGGEPVYIEGNPDDSGASYYLTANNEKLWVTYTRDKSYSIPQPVEKLEGSTKLWFDGWTGSSLSQKTRTLVIPKGSTGNRAYMANWTRGKYRIIYDSNISFLKIYQAAGKDYKTITDSGYNIEAWLNGTTPDQMVEYGTYPSISTSGYSLLGHVFVGWCRDSTTCREEKLYKAGTTTNSDLAIALSSENDTVKTVTMYAQWEPIVYKINYVNDQEGVVNTNRSSYTILDQFKLEPAQLPEWSGGEWYTVNPYTESYSENNIGWCKNVSATGTINERIASASNCRKDDYTTGAENTRNDYLFGTYSYGKDGANNTSDVKLYLFQKFNKINDGNLITYSSQDNNKVSKIGVKEDGDNYTLKDVKGVNWIPQQISYGTYGDLTLYSYLDKYYDLAFIYNYIEWKNSTQAGKPVWTPVETSQELLGVYRIKNGSEAPTLNEMSGIIQKITSALNSSNTNNVVGYTFNGLQSEKGRKIFNADGTPYEQATEFWTTSKFSSEGSVEKKVFWTYVGGENVVKVFVGWEPLTYLIKLHSNY